MTEMLFETALGIGAPWHVAGADFNAQARTLTIRVDFAAGSRFAVPGVAGERPVHDTVAKRYRHLNFFQHECFLEVRVPRVKLPDGAVRQIEAPWAGKLSGFTLLFEALVSDVVPADDLRRRGAAGRRELAPGGRDLGVLRRVELGASGFLRRARTRH
jgi:hypothetical protein